MPKVSVIIPVYNVQKYLKECLDSLVEQTIKDDIEVIVVNDGSTDKSQDIIDEYTKKYPEIFKSYIKENGGQGSARNYGVKMAKRRIYRICRFRWLCRTWHVWNFV